MSERHSIEHSEETTGPHQDRQPSDGHSHQERLHKVRCGITKEAGACVCRQQERPQADSGEFGSHPQVHQEKGTKADNQQSVNTTVNNLSLKFPACVRSNMEKCLSTCSSGLRRSAGLSRSTKTSAENRGSRQP